MSLNLNQSHLTQVKSFISGREFDARRKNEQEGGIRNFKVSPENLKSLEKFGIFYPDAAVKNLYQVASAQKQASAFAFDSVELQPSITSPTVPTPIQFLQYWCPGQVTVMTDVRRCDDLMGYYTLGNWADEQVVQTVVEMLGNPNVYLDYSDNLFSSYNPSYNVRTIVRLQIGLKVSQLESQRAAAGNLDDAGWKRNSAAYNLEIARNQIEFYGFNNGANMTYGFLNAPELPPYVEVAPNAAGTSTLWADKTALEIIQNILTAEAAVLSQSGGNYDPESMAFTLAVPTNQKVWLTQTTQFQYIVKDWLAKTMPKLRIIDAPQLENAYADSNVFYLYGERITDMSTDGGETWLAGGPTKLMLLGVQQLTDGFEERYTMASMGAMCKRPIAVVRYYGI